MLGSKSGDGSEAPVNSGSRWEEDQMVEGGVDQILVVTAIGDRTKETRPERGLGDTLVAKSLSAVDVSILKKNMDRFFHQLREILDAGSDKVGAFEVAQVEISAQIAGDGQVCLMGSGVKVEMQGGIKFVLKRGGRS